MKIDWGCPTAKKESSCTRPAVFWWLGYLFVAVRWFKEAVWLDLESGDTDTERFQSSPGQGTKRPCFVGLSLIS